VLTVDYDRLGVRPGDRLLDMGAGGGRHAFEAAKRGAHVVALDADAGELKNAKGILDELGHGGACVNGDALRLPFPTGTFDRIIAAEVFEHIPPDVDGMRELARVLRPGGTIAVTVPRWFPERVNWALSEEYHAPIVEGGHVRIYRQRELISKLKSVGLRFTGHHHAHSLHTPYWWIRCAVGPQDDDHPLTKLYHRFLVWDLMKRPLVTRIADRVLNPVIGKSLVVYLEKPSRD
jgi:SAM-dependent methyltransferase